MSSPRFLEGNEQETDKGTFVDFIVWYLSLSTWIRQVVFNDKDSLNFDYCDNQTFKWWNERWLGLNRGSIEESEFL